MMTFFAVLFGLMPSVLAIVPPISSQTRTVDNNLANVALGLSPKPTAPPSNAELRRRQANQNVLFVAPDATCGYESGSSSYAVSCGVGATCAAYYNSALDVNVLGCCKSRCWFTTTCYDYFDVYSSSACGDSCQSNPEVLACTETASPYCHRNTVPGMNMGMLMCAGFSYSTIGEVRTTYDGQPTTGIWTTLDAAEASESFGIVAFPPLSLSLLSTSSSTSSASSTTTTSTSSSPAATTTPASPPKEKTPLGAIIGGAVGGVAVLAALGAGIFFCLRRRKSRDNVQQDPQAGPGMVQYHSHPSPNGNEPGSPAPTYFAPGTASNKAYDAKYAQPAVYEQPPSGPSSPSPVYREQYSPPPMAAPAFNSAPPPPTDSRYQAYQPPPPPLQVVPGGQVYYPPPAERNAASPAPAELGIRSPLPGTVNGRPLYEAA